MRKNKAKVAVVGGGLVGAMEACFLAKQGYEVHLYEYRKDIRTMDHVPGKSINLAMSVRGLSALEHLGLGEHVAKEYGIPMRARMIHARDGSTYPIPYGKEGQCIYSVGRRYVNEILLTAGEKFTNLHIHFEHKLTRIDIDNAAMTFQNHERHVSASADFVLGCDGAFSTVRAAFMKKPGFNFSQEYIPHDYLELCIPATSDNEFAMPPNFLHIWPRGTFMLIALPNQDKSFTVTLFMPGERFKSLKNGDDLLTFFGIYFSDAIPLIGRDRLIEDFFATKPSSLVSIKCSPYNWKDKVLILGDAAHAMVPFYGQGMNCGMEDVLVLDKMLQENLNDHDGNLDAGRLKAFQEYSAFRSPDSMAICDLALGNYIESWVPLYTSVTFTRMRYHHCIENRKWQDKILTRLLVVSGFAAAGSAAIGLGALAASAKGGGGGGGGGRVVAAAGDRAWGFLARLWGNKL